MKRIVFLLVLVLTLALLPSAQPAGAATGPRCYVDDSATGNNDGDTWADAYTSLQSALADSNCAKIWVAKGIYYPGTNQTDTFVLKNNVEIYGGFAGTETALNQRNPEVNITILSGDIDQNDKDINGNGLIEFALGDIITGTNAYHVITAPSGVNHTAVLDGFFITAGQANGSSPHHRGGGMYNDQSSPTLRNLVFIGNSAQNGGGGIYNYQGSPTLTNVAFIGNSATDPSSWGGGMFNSSSSNPTLMDVTFYDNSANDGGGMYNGVNSSPMLINVAFIGNSATHWGGGIYNRDQSNPTLINVIFSGNSADNPSTPAAGGGMYNYINSDPTLINVTFWGNFAKSRGAGITNNEGSDPTLINVIMWGDTISGTVVQEIFNFPVPPATSPSTPTISYSDIQGCIVSGNWQTSCGNDGGHNIDANPLFVKAKGPDNTPGTLDDNLRLRATSPAIDAGDNTVIPTGVITDLDGKPRRAEIPSVPNTGNGTPPIVDMGAYEVQNQVYLPLIRR